MICKNTRKPDLTECLLGFDLYLANGESPEKKHHLSMGKRFHCQN